MLQVCFGPPGTFEIRNSNSLDTGDAEAADFSWGASAKSYIDAYQWAIAARHGTGEPHKATG